MDWKKIRKEYETSSITLKALADKYGIKLGTLKSRKSREKWQKVATLKNATRTKKVASKNNNKKKSKTKSIDVSEALADSEELTDKQRLFCIYYLKYFNATKAYQKAYGCDYISAKSNGYRLLTKDYINIEVDRLKKEQAEELKLDVRDVLQKYIDIAFADITDFTDFGKKEVSSKDEEGNIKTTFVNYVDIKDSSAIDGTIVTEVKQSKEGITVKLADKMKALEKLEKYFDLLPDQHKRQLEIEKSNLDKQKYELDKRIVELREREEQTKGW